MRLRLLVPLTVALAGVAACGAEGDAPAPAARSRPPAPATIAATNVDWPTFDRDARRSGATNRATGITRADVARLQRRTVALPGTVDSAPIYLHAVRVAGATRDVFVMTTTYGRTLAVDAASGRILWTFTPPGYGSWAGTYRITNATPTADSDRRHVFAASPDGRVHRLSLATGAEARGGRWPVAVTKLPAREKLTSSLNLVRGRVIVTTGGYIGDAPPYQGHVVALDRVTGRIAGVVNSLCADRHRIIAPSSCGASDSAIWSRSGAAVGPGGRLYVATGNGPYDGRRNFGDSVLRLTPDARHVTGHWTPPNAADLEAGDVDVGSTGPAWLGGDLLLQGGKDARLRLLRGLRQVQQLPAPGGAGVFTAPAVWRHGRRTTVVVATAGGTAAYAVRAGRLHLVWGNGTGGTSPIVAGGLAYVYDPGGALNVYVAGSGRRVAHLPAGPGHWNSPVIGGGRIALPQGDANDHAQAGVLNLYVRP